MIESVYIIYSADLLSESPRDIESMAPAKHVPASIGGWYPDECARISEAFRETEDDSNYDFGYLGAESGNVRYFPFGYVDKEGLTRPYIVRSVIDADDTVSVIAWNEDDATDTVYDAADSIGVDVDELTADEDESAPMGLGQHRKWVGELTLDEWRVFARAYCIDLDDADMPEEYEDTMGSLTVEYGHIPAIAIDNTHGWEYPGGPDVIYSSFYVSFACRDRDHNHERGAMMAS